MPLGDDDLDGHSLRRRDDDSTFVRIAIRRPTADASPPLPYPAPSRWRDALHDGDTDPDAVDVATLDDGTIRRDDNAHADRKGHELDVAPDPDPRTIDVPGIPELYERFWEEIPKPRIEP